MEAGRERPRRQGGAALLLMLIGAVGIGVALFVGGLGDKRGERERHNALVLAAAKEALIGYAVTKGNPPGSFPCPDVTNSGTAASSCSSAMIGRLPWKTIGLADVRDADGECLWYALSPAFKTGAGSLNSTKSGTLTIKNDSGMTLAAQLLAVVFTPGAPVAGNNRTATGPSVCGGNASAPNYLDASPIGISNATGNRSGSNFTFVAGQRTETFNDQLIPIAAGDLFVVLHSRVAAEIRGDEDNGLRRYFAERAVLPWAAVSAGGGQQAQRTRGYVAYGDPELRYPGSAWLNANGWFGLAGYEVAPPDTARITIGSAAYAYEFR